MGYIRQLADAVFAVLFVVVLSMDLLAINVENEQYRIQTVKETSGWNSVGYEHIVDFEWKANNTNSVTRDFCMRTPVRLVSGSTAEILTSINSVTSTYDDFVNLSSYGSINESCGKIHHYWVSWSDANGTMRNETRCFDSYEVIPEGFRIRTDFSTSTMFWRDVTNAFSWFYVANDSANYYCVPVVTWSPGEVKTVRFRYWDDARSSFKWDALFGDLSTGHADLVLDPFTNSTLYAADFTLDNISYHALTINATLLNADDLVANARPVYSFDNSAISGATIVDGAGLTNGTWSSGTITNNRTGILGEAVYFDGTDEITTGYNPGGDSYLWCVWLNLSSIQNTNKRPIQFYGYGGSFLGTWGGGCNANKYCAYQWDDAGAWRTANSLTNQSVDVWNFICGGVNHTTKTLQVWVNGVNEANVSISTVPTVSGDLFIGGVTGATGFSGAMDEFFFAKVAPNQRLISALYNAGRGMTYPYAVAGTFASKNISASVNTTYFTPMWFGAVSNISVSFDGGLHAVNASNAVEYEWPYSIANVLTYRISLGDGETFRDFTIAVSDRPIIASESDARASIIEAATAVFGDDQFQIVNDRAVYQLLANGSHLGGRFDIYLIAESRRYVFNYDPSPNMTFPMAYSLSPAFYVWQARNLTRAEIIRGVQEFIDNST